MIDHESMGAIDGPAELAVVGDYLQRDRTFGTKRLRQAVELSYYKFLRE